MRRCSQSSHLFERHEIKKVKRMRLCQRQRFYDYEKKFLDGHVVLKMGPAMFHLEIFQVPSCIQGMGGGLQIG